MEVAYIGCVGPEMHPRHVWVQFYMIHWTEGVTPKMKWAVDLTDSDEGVRRFYANDTEMKMSNEQVFSGRLKSSLGEVAIVFKVGGGSSHEGLMEVTEKGFATNTMNCSHNAKNDLRYKWKRRADLKEKIVKTALCTDYGHRNTLQMRFAAGGTVTEQIFEGLSPNKVPFNSISLRQGTWKPDEDGKLLVEIEQEQTLYGTAFTLNDQTKAVERAQFYLDESGSARETIYFDACKAPGS